MSKKLSLKLNKDKFPDFVDKLKDISNISDVLKIKICKENILMYSMKANDTAVLALKSYLLNTKEYMEDFKEEEMYDLIIINSVKFIKGLQFFDNTTPIKLDLVCKQHYEEENVMQIRTAQFTNGKLKISTVSGEESRIRNINSETLEERTDIDNSEWTFKVAKQDFINVKKLSSIDSEEKILTINVEKGEVVAGENNKWELNLGQTDDKVNSKIVFNKKYLSNINSDIEEIDFYMFETFILVKDNNSNLMLSFEQSFDDD